MLINEHHCIHSLQTTVIIQLDDDSCAFVYCRRTGSLRRVTVLTQGERAVLGAAIGAGICSIFGPVGAIVGGAIGGLIGSNDHQQQPS
jgi:hypothetical protein